MSESRDTDGHAELVKYNKSFRSPETVMDTDVYL